MTGKILKIGAAVLVTAAVAFATVAVRATDSPEAMAKRKLDRELAQRRTMESKLRTLDWRKTPVMDAGMGPGHVSTFDNSIMRTPSLVGNAMYASAGAPPPPSPGLWIANTTYDYQANGRQSYQTARISSSNCVHFVWMAWDRFPQSVDDDDRYVAYNSFSITGPGYTGTLNQGFGGTFIGLSSTARAGYCNVDVDAGNLAHIALHQRQDPTFPYHCWRVQMPVACLDLHVDDELTGTNTTSCGQVLWPSIASSRGGDSVIIHEIGVEDVNDCNRGLLYYWRNNAGSWKGPVVIDSTQVLGYTIADCPTNNKLAVALQPSDGSLLLNVAYHESNTAGYGWLTGSELGSSSRIYITNYTDPEGPQSWDESSTTYDNNGVLHIVYPEQRIANNSEDIRIVHWNSSRNTLRPVALGYWPGLNGASAFNLNLSKVTVGIGDGSSMCSNGSGDEANNNYVYVSYIQFAGPSPAEQADISVDGYFNGELYLAVSNSGGNTWSPPSNLSNTKTPDCNPGIADTGTGIPATPDSVCRSEHWQTIGRAVGDVDILFISDKDAGGIPQGEGTWQQNPVHWLRLDKGTHAQYVCPVIAPVFEATLTSATECEYHSTQTGTDLETLTIINLGNATLSGNVTVTDFPLAATLTVAGIVTGVPTAYSITAGALDIVKGVTMTANNVPEGLYQASISISHNDVTKANPRVYPIDYFVVNNFFCPENEVLMTGVASPGSLALQVESNGRFGSQNDYGGLWRFSDTSASIFDASLLIAHGPQNPDTTVYLRFFSKASNGQYGFRALTNLIQDTTAYHTHTGQATATAYMCTADSVVGIKMSWFFPQAAANDEFVICQYRLYRNQPATPITDLAIGVLADNDVVPAARLGTIQSGAENSAGGDASRKLGYQIGVDTTNHVISGTKTATRFRGGVAACGDWNGTRVGNNTVDIQPGGGPTDGFLYRKLQTLSGYDPFIDSTIDMYTLVALGKGMSIGVNDTLTYTLVWAADTVSDGNFLSTIDAGLAYANAAGLCISNCNCPCQYDPQCDQIISDVLDVSVTINRAFRGAVPVIDPSCDYERTDVDGSGASDVLDVTKVINVAFRGAAAGAQYDLNLCAPGDQ